MYNCFHLSIGSMNRVQKKASTAAGIGIPPPPIRITKSPHFVASPRMLIFSRIARSSSSGSKPSKLCLAHLHSFESIFFFPPPMENIVLPRVWLECRRTARWRVSLPRSGTTGKINVSLSSRWFFGQDRRLTMVPYHGTMPEDRCIMLLVLSSDFDLGICDST